MVGGFIVGGPPIGGPFGGIGGAVGPVGRGGPPGARGALPVPVRIEDLEQSEEVDSRAVPGDQV